MSNQTGVLRLAKVIKWVSLSLGALLLFRAMFGSGVGDWFALFGILIAAGGWCLSWILTGFAEK